MQLDNSKTMVADMDNINTLIFKLDSRPIL